MQTRMLLTAINTIFITNDYSRLVLGLLGVPIFASIIVWPICLVKVGISNLIHSWKGIYKSFPYQNQLDSFQMLIASRFCSWCSEQQFKVTRVLNLPPEIIIEINKYIIPEMEKSYLQRLPRFNNQKAIMDNFVFSPEYIVVSHQSIWIIVFCREILNVSVFVVGYFTILRVIWML